MKNYLEALYLEIKKKGEKEVLFNLQFNMINKKKGANVKNGIQGCFVIY